MSGNARVWHSRCQATLFLVLLLTSIFVLVSGCGGGGGSKKSTNPMPVLTAVSPAAAVAGGTGFTLTATGSGFVAGSAVHWDGVSRATTFVSPTQVTASILASDIATARIAQITVFNPAPGGGTSAALSFTVQSAPADPIRVSLSPTTAEVEVGKRVQLTAAVTGTANTAVHWSVSGIVGGNSTVGTISNTGEYTAPLNRPSPNSLTIAATSAADGTASGTAIVTVANCSLAAPGPASTQAQARLGAYYFDGWSGPLTNFHFNGLVNGPYQDRQPLTGWLDSSPCAVEQQFAWARRFGIDYFIFLWYHDPLLYEDDDLNSALQITRGLADRHGMQYAIMYTDHDPFTVRPDDWPATVNEWVGYMTDPDYVRVNGMPMLVVYDAEAMRQAFGSSAAVAEAFNQLRAAARAQGLAGVYIVGGIFAGYDPIHGYGYFPDLSAVQADGYDALSIYNWSFGEVRGEQPFSILAEAGQWVWGQASLKSALPFIPTAMAGWDARPWYEPPAWFRRSPGEVTAHICSAITWANSNLQLRPEPPPGPPLVFIEAWNELGEGSYLVPTVGDGASYGDSLAAMLAAPACSPPQ